MKILKCIRHTFLVVILMCSIISLADNTVNINTADAATIAAVIVGVGEIKAAAIVAYRQENGIFKTIDDLLEVSGIGQITLDTNRHRIVLE